MKKIAIIEWIDECTCEYLEDGEILAPMIGEACGILLRETDDYIQMCLEVMGGGRTKKNISIPKCSLIYYDVIEYEHKAKRKQKRKKD